MRSAAIEYLKRSQIGRATFLPLNKLDKGSLSSRPNHAGVVDYALNLVDFDPKFLAAFWYVFRDTLVVESLVLCPAAHGPVSHGHTGRRPGGEVGSHDRRPLPLQDEVRCRREEEAVGAVREDRQCGSGAVLPGLDKLDRIEEQISHLSREVEELNKVISKKTFQMDEMAAVQAPPGEVHFGEARASGGRWRASL